MFQTKNEILQSVYKLFVFILRKSKKPARATAAG
jgi:hypothetical protein